MQRKEKSGRIRLKKGYFMRLKLLFSLLFSLTLLASEAALPELNSKKTVKIAGDMLKQHASHKELTPEMMGRIFQSFLDELDPTKTYFIEDDIDVWLNPSEGLLQETIREYKAGNFENFEEILILFRQAIKRRQQIDRELADAELPSHVDPEEFKDMQWTKNEKELKDRLLRIRGLQIETARKLNDELKEVSLQRIAKRQSKYEEEFLDHDKEHQQRLLFTKVLKATAASLDTHTTYFTPEEANQFIINVQQRLYGIGAQLRDDLNGFRITKIVEGGPAHQGKELKLHDRIIAVDGVPVVGMDITEAVALIRGEENTPVVLTVIRETEKNGEKQEETLDITVVRQEVIIKESRYDVSYEPYGDGVIGYLRLHTFYEDRGSSSAEDLARVLKEMQEEHNVKGVILDLRYNSGGLLSQAVAVTGLFISKGVVVSIKDNTGFVQHMRDLDGKSYWNGPLVVLVNKGSASASEIVAQTLQDYGRAIIVGDPHTFGKGSFQTFTLNSQTNSVNPDGEYKVTRGRYYTVSGKTPQLKGVDIDIMVPGILSEVEIGEKFGKFPLEPDRIKANFDDDLNDIPPMQREKIRRLYKFNLQPRVENYARHLPRLKENSNYRIEHNEDYQAFLTEIKKKGPHDEEDMEQFGQNDLQLQEAVNIIKDLIFLEQTANAA